jgi:hypothetical protein
MMALGALILICSLQDMVHGMPRAGFSLIIIFVIVPHGLALITALAAGALWMLKSFRTPAGDHQLHGRCV